LVVMDTGAGAPQCCPCCVGNSLHGCVNFSSDRILRGARVVRVEIGVVVRARWFVRVRIAVWRGGLRRVRLAGSVAFSNAISESMS